MELTLTDRLTCPRCGPTFGLILLADDLVDRRVRAGHLGCPNCRDRYLVSGGFADLRAPPRSEMTAGSAGSTPVATDDPEAQRLIALLGIPKGPGTVLMVGEPARYAGPLARSIEDLQVVAVDADAREWAEEAAVSRMATRPGLPFFSRTLRGVVVDARLGRGMLFEAARVVAPMSRVVAVHADEHAEDVLQEGGLTLAASESGTVVAARS